MVSVSARCLLLLAGFCLAATQALAQTPPPRDARNASFWWRVDNPPADPLQPPYDWYRPTTVLRGQPGAFLPAAPVATAPSAKGAAPRLAPRVLDEASQYAEATGATALIVVHRGAVVLERYYRGATAADVFSAHSLTKTLAALALGAAIDDGLIASADERASRWLPEWRDGKRDGITLRHLLTMSGGFRAPLSKDPGSHFQQSYYGADVEAIVRDAPLAFAPGSEYAADQDNLHALGLVIERAAGQPYQEYLSRRLWQPLGASDGKMLLDREGGRVMNNCCLLALPRDWARVGQMLLQDGQWQGKQVISARWLSEMRKPSAANANFGMQLFLGSAWLNPQINRYFIDTQKASLAPAAARDLYYLSGAAGQLLALLPEDELVILRAGKSAPAWRDQVLPNLLHGALHGEKAADWSWLYSWRLQSISFAEPPVFKPASPRYWPSERVAGGSAQPLPRKADACLNGPALAPALTELERTRSFAFLVWRDGVIQVERYWPGFDADSRIDPASMHKSVLALLVGQAVADGTIPGLDIPVSRWLTEWAADPRGRITVEQMLQMSSGLAPVKFDMAPGSATSLFMFGPDVNGSALGLALADPPGKQFNYISQVSQLLALILERATGRRYGDYLSARLWQPLGASDAYLSLDHPGGMARTSAHLLARPEDWVRLGMLFVHRGQVEGRPVVSPAWLKAMTTPAATNANYGYQLWLGSPHNPKRRYNTASEAAVPAREPFLADDMVYFDGSGGQRVYASAQEKLVIVRFGAPSFDWDDSLIPNRVVAAARQCLSTSKPRAP